MKGKIIVLGKGFLGARISETLGFELSDFRVPVREKSNSLEKFLEKEKPAVIINAIGKTHGKESGENNIDWCENNKEETLKSNVFALERLARACAAKNIYLVNLGSGCIYRGYNGSMGFSEKDKPNFGLNGEQYYALTKILAEQKLNKIAKEHPNFRFLQLRLRMPVDDFPSERNLITKLIGYSGVIDIQNSMTSVPNAIPAINQLMEQNATGIYNFVNPGTISAAQIMKLYKEIIDPQHEFKIISLSELKKRTIAVRSNCYLDTDKLKKSGIALPDIHDAVRESLIKYKGSLKH